jgi:hypothetical protein
MLAIYKEKQHAFIKKIFGVHAQNGVVEAKLQDNIRLDGVKTRMARDGAVKKFKYTPGCPFDNDYQFAC